MIGLDSYSRRVYLFGPRFDLYQSLNRLPIWNSQNCSVFPLAFVAGWLQGHWWGFISRNYVVWPTFLHMNVFIALKGSHFWFLFNMYIFQRIPILYKNRISKALYRVETHSYNCVVRFRCLFPATAAYLYGDFIDGVSPSMLRYTSTPMEVSP